MIEEFRQHWAFQSAIDNWQSTIISGAEQLLHRVHAVLGKDQETFVAQEETVGHEQVQVGMKVEIFPESMYGHNDTGHTLGLIQGDPHDIADTLLGDAAEVFEQIAVVAKIRAQHFGDGEGDVAVGNRKKDGLCKQSSEELYLFLVAGWAEPASFAGECQ